MSFKAQLVTFFDELIEQFPDESDLVIIRIFIKDQAPVADVMMYFVTDILPLRNVVKNRDESFFIDNNILFSKLEKGKVNHFKKLWRSNELDKNDRLAIWRWFDLFISLAEKYQKLL